MARLEMQISALKYNAVNKEVAEAEEKKEAKEKQMLLKILTSNGIEKRNLRTSPNTTFEEAGKIFHMFANAAAQIKKV